MESQVNPFEDFDPQVQQDVEGLIHLGALSNTVEFCGHEFTFRTLRIGEEIAAAAAIPETVRGTLKEAHAYATATIGLSLEIVDGDDAFCPQAGPDEDAYAKARYNYVKKRWYWPTVDFLYSEYTKLLERQLDAIRAMQDLSQRGLRTFSPSADSLIARDISSGEIPLGTPDLAS
jgi:hypothetical protein